MCYRLKVHVTSGEEIWRDLVVSGHTSFAVCAPRET